MPSPPLLPFDELLAPISEDEPSGTTVPFTLKQDLDEWRKSINPEDFDADDPMRPENPKFADWPKIISVTQETLKEKSKDLLTAARLTEALTKTHGYAGLRDGLQLMRRMVAECWDRILPTIEDGDLEVRAAAFNWLDDRDRGARFPTTLRGVPLFQKTGQDFSWMKWKQIQEGKGGVTAQDFEEAVSKATPEECQLLVEDLDGALVELNQVKDVLLEKLHADAPGLVEVQTALAECSMLAKQIWQRKAPVASEEETGDPEGADAGEGGGDGQVEGGGGKVRKMRTRDDIYNQLREAATLLQKMEPHSPIPYLIFKAVEWGTLQFPQLMKAMVQDDSVISQMNRELGIKEVEEES